MTLRRFKSHTPRLGERVYVDETALVIGQVALADDVSVWPGTVIRGDVNQIQIGRRSNVQDACVCHVTHDGPYAPGGFALTVGEDVTIGHRVVIHGCTIGDRVLIGMGAIVMDGAVVESEVLLGAGALVPQGKRLQSGYLYAGVPARQTRELSDEERASLAYSAQHYVKMKNAYLAERASGDDEAPPTNQNH
ncbi:MAG: gamma carbonic anhydrase family protein [Pseudomonadota bacterium]